MEPDLPSRKEKENPDQDSTKNKKKRYWKVLRIGALFGIIETFALVLWNKSEDFSPESATILRWFADCGFLSGAAYLAHKFVVGKHQKWKKSGIWSLWAVTCFILLLLTPAASVDENGNPIGLLLPANDPVPLKILIGPPKWVSNLIPDQNPWLTLPPNAKNEFFILMGGNYIALNPDRLISLVRFHGSDLFTLTLENGGASISGNFFDRSGNVVGVISNNSFTLDRQNFWVMKRPDKSTLIVKNHQNLEVLNIRFCRKNFFEMTGIFYFPDGSYLFVTKTNYYSSHGVESTGGIVHGDGGFNINNDGSTSIGYIH